MMLHTEKRVANCFLRFYVAHKRANLLGKMNDTKAENKI